MQENVRDWGAITKYPTFVELQKKKTLFLWKLWIFGVVSFFLLPVGAGYFQSILNTKVLGRLNVAYFLCLYEFALGWGIAIYYARRCNRDFDPLTTQVVDEIEKGARG